MAIATSLATILFTSVSSVRAHHKRGAVLWPVVKVLAPGILVGSLIGAQIAGRLPTVFIALFFGVFVGFSALQMLRDKKPKPSRELPRPLGMFGVGNAIGFISSLVGAGGGFISVPFMVWSNVKIHNAVATSAALGFPIAAAGTVGYIIAGMSEDSLPAGTVGFVYLPALLAVGSRERPHGAARRQGGACARHRPAEADLRAAAVRARGLHAVPRHPGGLIARFVDRGARASQRADAAPPDGVKMLL